MRRSTAIVLGGVVIAATVGVGTTAAIGAATGGSPSATSQARQIANSLSTASGRARYDLTSGHLVSADVCVRGSCVHRDYSSAPACSPSAGACIGTALVARRFPHGVTISAELV